MLPYKILSAGQVRVIETLKEVRKYCPPWCFFDSIGIISLLLLRFDSGVSGEIDDAETGSSGLIIFRICKLIW